MINRIKKLPDNLINRIAAGEVVERPASALKEVMENSIDAKANNISVELINGGISQIKVCDNGGGIIKDDLPLALDRHATSKIQDEDDLYHITTLGFRGEGIASIASISDFTISSRIKDEQAGYKITSDFGKYGQIAPVAINPGTIVQINDLYHNIPARKKFLKTETTEYGHCKAVFERIALSHPQISFELKHNGKLVYNLPIQNTLERIAQMFGDEYRDKAIEVFETQTNGESITGYVYHANSLENSKNIQFSYLNQRFVRDKVIQNAIKQAFSGVLHGDTQPQYVLFIEVDPKEVDVNVHPTKSEVRFRESGRVHSFISSSIKKALTTSSVLRNQSTLGNDFIVNPRIGNSESSYSSSSSSSNFSNRSTNFDRGFSGSSSGSSSYTNPIRNTDNSTLVKSWINPNIVKPKSPELKNDLFVINPEDSNNDLSNSTYPPLGFAVAQLHGVYILAQAQNGLIIVDIHAAHERITLEKLKSDLNNNHHLACEILLIPVSLDIDETLYETAKQHLADFEKLGFELELISTTQISIKSHPMLLESNNIAKLVLKLINEFESFGNSNSIESLQEEILADMACHCAIRANHELNIAQMNAILRQLETTNFGSFCNHGRPTWFEFSMAELDKMFLRGK